MALGVRRDKAYLVYSAFAGWMAVWQLSATGLGSEFFWGDHLAWADRAVHWAISFVLVLGVYFARIFLDTRHSMPRLDRLLTGLTCILLANLALLGHLPNDVIAKLHALLALVAVAMVLTAGWISLRQGRPGSRYFLVAWLSLCVSGIVQALYNFGVIPLGLVADNAVRMGSAIEMVLLSLALADRINELRRQKDEAVALHKSEQEQKEKAAGQAGEVPLPGRDRARPAPARVCGRADHAAVPADGGVCLARSTARWASSRQRSTR